MYSPDSELKFLAGEERVKQTALANCLYGLGKEIQATNPNLIIVGVNAVSAVVSVHLQTGNNLVFQINSDSSSYTPAGQFVATARKFDLAIFRAIRRLPRGERPAEGNEEGGEIILEAAPRTRDELLEELKRKIPSSVHWN